MVPPLVIGFVSDEVEFDIILLLSDKVEDKEVIDELCGVRLLKLDKKKYIRKPKMNQISVGTLE